MSFKVTYNDFDGVAHAEIVNGSFDDLVDRVENLHLSGCEEISTVIDDVEAA